MKLNRAATDATNAAGAVISWKSSLVDGAQLNARTPGETAMADIRVMLVSTEYREIQALRSGHSSELRARTPQARMPPPSRMGAAHLLPSIE